MSVNIRQSTPDPVPQSSLPEPELNTTGASYDERDIEPIDLENSSLVLEALGIEEELDSIPEEDLENLEETKKYILDIINKRGDSPTMGAFRETLNDIKAEFGLSDSSDPSTILDRIGGVVKAWKSLSFVSDPKDKRRIFMQLAKAQDSKSMNKIVFEEMERYQVWQ